MKEKPKQGEKKAFEKDLTRSKYNKMDLATQYLFQVCRSKSKKCK